MMTDAHRAARFEGLHERTRRPLQLLVEELEMGLGDDLRSITVIGSSLTPDFQPATSDINTVVLLEAYDMPALDTVAGLMPSLSRYQVAPPLLMTRFHIERSRDVFGVEFLDFQLTHETILGEDPFRALHFDKRHVRLQCERELKAMLVRLRQGYLSAAGRRGMIRDLLISGGKGLAPLLRALLWLRDVDRPRTMDATFRKAAGEFDVDFGAVLTAHQWRQQKPHLTDAEMESVFLAVVDAVEGLTTIVDGLEL